jgi:hypothetical protein
VLIGVKQKRAFGHEAVVNKQPRSPHDFEGKVNGGFDQNDSALKRDHRIVSYSHDNAARTRDAMLDGKFDSPSIPIICQKLWLIAIFPKNATCLLAEFVGSFQE